MDMKTRGRPSLSKETVTGITRKLQPYLEAGFSLRKACLQSGLPTSTVYDLVEKNSEFAGEISKFRNFQSVLVSSIVAKKVHEIMQKQVRNEPLSSLDLKLLMWVATHSVNCKEEFGRPKDMLSSIEPEVELRRIISEIDKVANS